MALQLELHPLGIKLLAGTSRRNYPPIEWQAPSVRLRSRRHRVGWPPSWGACR